MTQRITVDLQLEEQTEEDSESEYVRAGIDVRASNTDGNPLSEATFTVTGADGETDQGDGKSAGMSTSFENVALPATILAEATGYKSEEISVGEGDLGGNVYNY